MLDLNPYEETRKIAQNADPVVVINDYAAFYGPHISIDVAQQVVHKTAFYQFRHVVHRQYIGFYTGMVFDVVFNYAEKDATDNNTLRAMNIICEPFVEGALCMNHTSHFIVDLLKGSEAGFNRKHVLEDIVKKVGNTNDLWYSDWITPPPTRQSQRILIYDLEQFGSMLDPINVVKQTVRLIRQKLRAANTGMVYGATIVAGYTTPVK